MHGHEWNGEQDPTGWIISEKLDGLRAFWDGKRLFSKRGQPILAPVDFTGPLPSGTCLDGELWIDYGCFNTISSMYRKSHLANNADLWRDVKYCVFDAPMHPGSYPERHSFASKSISGSGPHVCSIPIQRCLGLPHLKATLQEVTQKKGEGLMLYHPEAPHTPGRTSNLLKVKAYSEEDVKLLQCNPNSYSFLCEQKNGATCTVKCSGWDYMNPPAPGTILTVKHSGYFKTSQKLKYPFLLRFRPEITWQEIPNTQP
uniref:ATP-dependent DNA ligase family profile domain-containing protein n=1 Tax=Arcella intermedia TaxID=1963864 RepID=A0A6B2LEL7_9EUKA